MIKQLSTIAICAVLCACNNGSGSNDPLLFNTEQDQAIEPSGACANDYHRELIGTYDGEIAFDNGETQCAWTVDLQVTGESVSGLCLMSYNAVSELHSNESCVDIGIGGQLHDPSFTARPDLLSSVVWPVDLYGQLNSALPDNGLINPLNIRGNQFRVTADGMGNLIIPDSVSAEPEYSGVLVKRFDLTQETSP